jgi:hypothetical protein
MPRLINYYDHDIARQRYEGKFPRGVSYDPVSEKYVSDTHRSLAIVLIGVPAGFILLLITLLVVINWLGRYMDEDRISRIRANADKASANEAHWLLWSYQTRATRKKAIAVGLLERATLVASTYIRVMRGK